MDSSDVIVENTNDVDAGETSQQEVLTDSAEITEDMKKCDVQDEQNKPNDDGETSLNNSKQELKEAGLGHGRRLRKKKINQPSIQIKEVLSKSNLEKRFHSRFIPPLSNEVTLDYHPWTVRAYPFIKSDVLNNNWIESLCGQKVMFSFESNIGQVAFNCSKLTEVHMSLMNIINSRLAQQMITIEISQPKFKYAYFLQKYNKRKHEEEREANLNQTKRSLREGNKPEAKEDKDEIKKESNQESKNDGEAKVNEEIEIKEESEMETGLVKNVEKNEPNDVENSERMNLSGTDGEEVKIGAKDNTDNAKEPSEHKYISMVKRHILDEPKETATVRIRLASLHKTSFEKPKRGSLAQRCLFVGRLHHKTPGPFLQAIFPMAQTIITKVDPDNPVLKYVFVEALDNDSAGGIRKAYQMIEINGSRFKLSRPTDLVERILLSKNTVIEDENDAKANAGDADNIETNGGKMEGVEIKVEEEAMGANGEVKEVKVEQTESSELENEQGESSEAKEGDKEGKKEAKIRKSTYYYDNWKLPHSGNKKMGKQKAMSYYRNQDAKNSNAISSNVNAQSMLQQIEQTKNVANLFQVQNQLQTAIASQMSVLNQANRLRDEIRFQNMQMAGERLSNMRQQSLLSTPSMMNSMAVSRGAMSPMSSSFSGTSSNDFGKRSRLDDSHGKNNQGNKSRNARNRKRNQKRKLNESKNGSSFGGGNMSSLPSSTNFNFGSGGYGRGLSYSTYIQQRQMQNLRDSGAYNTSVSNYDDYEDSDRYTNNYGLGSGFSSLASTNDQGGSWLSMARKWNMQGNSNRYGNPGGGYY